MRTITMLLLAFLTTVALAGNQQNAPVSSLVRVSFPNGSIVFKPDADAKERLKDAPSAAMIFVSGRTSAKVASLSDEARAFRRAASARQYLIDQGVSPLKIMLNYVSADDYATDNTTPEGKRINRRVDIEMVFLPVL